MRNANIKRLRELKEQGLRYSCTSFKPSLLTYLSMSACNQFGESLIHLACRRADLDTVRYLLENGANPLAVDDFGRTPLHDACWRVDPRFDIIVYLLQCEPNLLRCQDVRGALALSYVIEENWLAYCAFFFYQRNRYWPAITSR